MKPTLLVISVILLSTVFSPTHAFAQETDANIEANHEANLQEYRRAIYALQEKIWSLDGYIIDSNDYYWTATDPTGVLSFEGKLYTGSDSDGYTLKLKSLIDARNYCTPAPRIEIPYVIDRRRHGKLSAGIGPHAKFDSLLFALKNTRMIYYEKAIDLEPSLFDVFEESSHDENYVVTGNDDKGQKHTTQQQESVLPGSWNYFDNDTVYHEVTITGRYIYADGHDRDRCIVTKKSVYFDKEIWTLEKAEHGSITIRSNINGSLKLYKIPDLGDELIDQYDWYHDKHRNGNGVMIYERYADARRDSLLARIKRGK